jgi:hypothetical protein
METMKLLAFFVIVGGAQALSFSRVSNSKQTYTADIGDWHLAMHMQRLINIPVRAGIRAMISAVPLLKTSRRT